MRAAIIEDGVVTNVIVVDDLDVIPGLIDGEGAAIGDLWDGETFIKPDAAPVDLAALKVAKNAEINRWRDEANATSFPYAGKLIAVDFVSYKDIMVTAGNISLFGTFPPDWPGGWKAMDNTYIAMPTIDDFKAMYAAMTQRGLNNFTHSQALKAAKDAATTPEEVAAIVW
jgi:hypothetical protein